jgi:hypothetical protein
VKVRKDYVLLQYYATQYCRHVPRLCPEDGGGKFLQNVVTYLPNHTELYLKAYGNLHIYVTRQANRMKHVNCELNTEPLTVSPV